MTMKKKIIAKAKPREKKTAPKAEPKKELPPKPEPREQKLPPAPESKEKSLPPKPDIPASPPSSPPPQEVYLAIRKLLDTTNHIQARAAELENALGVLREQERAKAVRDLLLALRHSQDGDLLRFDPATSADGEASQAKAIAGAMVEAFAIEPVHRIGERIPIRQGEIPDSLELDRSIGQEEGKCVAAEVISVGWKLKQQTLLKPMVRPVFGKAS